MSAACMAIRNNPENFVELNWNIGKICRKCCDNYSLLLLLLLHHRGYTDVNFFTYISIFMITEMMIVGNWNKPGELEFSSN